MALINGNGTYGPYAWNGGAYDFLLQGAVGGATVSLQYSTDDGTNKTEETSLSAEGHLNGSIGICNFYFVVTGHTTDFYAQIAEAKGAVSSSSSGLAQDSTLSNLLTEMQGHAPGTSAEPVVVEDGGSLFDPNITTFNAVDINTAAVSLGSPTAGQYAVLSDLLISCDADCTVSLYSTSETLALLKVKADGTSVQYTPRAKVKSTVANERIKLRANAASNAIITSLTYNEA